MQFLKDGVQTVTEVRIHSFAEFSLLTNRACRDDVTQVSLVI